MKVGQIREHTVIDGDAEVIGFRINASAHAFQILSSRLYSDPLRAIIRELSTNAADAHMAAGNTDKPFDVQLPNTMNPYFIIRDYGTGLSPDDIRNVYTVVFESDKT